MKSFFNKLEYRFLVECTKIETAIFRYKIALSEANVKTNKMGSTKRNYHKEGGFAINYFFFFKIPDFGVSTAMLNTGDISRRLYKLNFGPLRGYIK